MKLFANCGPETEKQNRGKRYELMIWTILLAVINSPLLVGKTPDWFIFDVELVKTGRLWRIVTYPFAHVSGYHLLLDATAFLMIYGGLEEKSTLKRLSYTAACGIGSLLLSLVCSKTVGTIGLSGLSGIAHGLTAVTSLELLKNHEKKSALFKIGVVVSSVVAIKSIVEVYTGEVVFSSLHLGDVGIPVVESHLGGVLGGIISFIILNRGKGVKTSDVKVPQAGAV